MVTVSGTVQETLVVTGDDLDAWHDMTDPPYRTHTTGNTQNGPSPQQATSIPAILTHLPTPLGPANVTYVTARAEDGAHATRLAGTQLDGGGYQDGAKPGFWADGDRGLVRFARPMRSDDDVNAPDVWLTRNNGRATLEVHTSGQILSPTIVASAATTQAGAPVTFRVDGVPAGATYAWTFGDGSTAGGATPQHGWDAAGTYQVDLEVTAGDSEGTATPVRVQVGATPPATGGEQPGTGTGGANNTPTGPTQGQGTTPNGSTTGQGSAATGSGTADGSASGTGGKAGSSTTPGIKPQGKQKKDKDTAADVGTQVSGTLLADPVAAVAPAAPAAPAPAAPARAVPRPQHDWRFLWFLVLPGLLLLGSTTQSRWLQRRLPDVPWRTT